MHLIYFLLRRTIALAYVKLKKVVSPLSFLFFFFDVLSIKEKKDGRKENVRKEKDYKRKGKECVVGYITTVARRTLDLRGVVCR